MIDVATLESALPTRWGRKFTTGYYGWTTEFLPHRVEGQEPQGPHAYRVEFSADSVSQPHFHFNDQFQVCVAGSGTLGRHAFEPMTVHYANGHTGYGPIHAGPEGLTILTLRQVVDRSMCYLPQDGAKQDRSAPKLTITSAPCRVSEAGVLAERHTPQTEALLEAQKNGVAAWLMRIPPKATVAAPDHEGSARYYVVVGGALGLRGEALPELSVVWASQEEAAVKLTAGAQGAELLVLQFARRKDS